MSVETLPDVEGALRAYLRADTGVRTVAAQRVFFGVPKNATEDDYPMVVVQRVGGGDPGIVPLDVALIQIDCWGRIDDHGHGVKSGATALVNAVRSALRSVNGRTALNASVDAFGCAVESVLWLPDPDDDRPRYVLTTEVSAMSS